MPLPNPTSTWKLAKYLVRGAGQVLPAAYLWLEDYLVGDEEVSELAWMKWVIEFNKQSPVGTSEDKAQIAFHLLNITGGAVDSSWTAGDFTTVKTQSDNIVTACLSMASLQWSWAGVKAYKMQFDPEDPGPGLRRGSGHSQFLDTGPPVYQAAGAGTGTSSLVVPQQCATTVTFRTALPKHWGRVYVPGVGSIQSNGRIGATHAKTLADAFHDAMDSLGTSGFLHVVPVGQMGHLKALPGSGKFHGLLGVHEYVVDDIPDVVRRRRPRQAYARTIGA